METPVALSYFTTGLEADRGNKLVPWDENVLCVQLYTKLTIVKEIGQNMLDKLISIKCIYIFNRAQNTISMTELKFNYWWTVNSFQELILQTKNALLFLKITQLQEYKTHCFNGKIIETSGTDRISLQSSNWTDEGTHWHGCEEAKARPACCYPSKREWSFTSVFLGLIDTHDSHNSYSISRGKAIYPVFFIRMDKSMFCSATTDNTCLLSFLDLHANNANTNSSWLQSQWQKPVCEQPEGSYQCIFSSDKAIFRL